MIPASIEWIPTCPDSKEGRISCSGVNAVSYFISQHEVMSESPVETLKKALGNCIIWTCGLASLHTLRGVLRSILQKVMMPDTS